MIYSETTFYATVFDVYPHEKFKVLAIGTSELNRDGSYKNSYWRPLVCGVALSKLENVKKGDRIKVTSYKLEMNPRSVDSKEFVLGFRIFDAEILPPRNSAQG